MNVHWMGWVPGWAYAILIYLVVATAIVIPVAVRARRRLERLVQDEVKCACCGGKLERAVIARHVSAGTPLLCGGCLKEKRRLSRSKTVFFAVLVGAYEVGKVIQMVKKRLIR